MSNLLKVIKLFSKFAEIPVYPKCSKCGNADPYLGDNGLCYKCDDPTMKKDPALEKAVKEPPQQSNYFDDHLQFIAKKFGLIPYMAGLDYYVSISSPKSLDVRKDDINDGAVKLYSAFPAADKNLLDQAETTAKNNQLHVTTLINKITLHYETTFKNVPATNDQEFHILVIDWHGKELAVMQYDKEDIKQNIKNEYDFTGAKKAGLPIWFIRLCEIGDDRLPID